MWLHFVHLLYRVWLAWLAQMSSSTPAQTFAASVFVVTQLFKSSRNVRENGRFSLGKLKKFWADHWKDNIRDGVLAIIVVAIFGGTWLVVNVAYQDHQNLVTRISQLESMPKLACPTCPTCPTIKPCKVSPSSFTTLSGTWKLSPEQENDLRGYLKKNFVARWPPIVDFEVLNDRDPEPFDFAKELHSVFVSSGLFPVNVRPSSILSGSSPFYGVMVYAATTAPIDRTKGSGV